MRRDWSAGRPTTPAGDADGMLAEGEELVAGRRPVEEVFVGRRDAIRLLVVPQRRQALEKLVLHATSLRIPIIEVEGGTLTALAGFDGHQGIAVVVPPRRFATLEDILARAIERGEPPFVLALDSLEDPQNVGTLLRSAEAAGVHGVLFPTRRQAPLTPAAVKASAGAVEHLLLCPVEDLPAALADLHVRGLRVAGAEADAPLTARQADLRGPLAIVVGSEGQGLGPAVRRRCDLLMRIPMRGAIDSLNASVAGSILLFEAVAQRDPEGRSRQPTRRATAFSPSLAAPLAPEDREEVAPGDGEPEADVAGPALPASEAPGPSILAVDEEPAVQAAPVSADDPASSPAGEAASAPRDEPAEEPTVAPAGDGDAAPAVRRPHARRARAASPPPGDEELLPGGPAVTEDPQA
jgi:23S rRNA (guanosine2251-2'-O)-methyltransferase